MEVNHSALLFAGGRTQASQIQNGWLHGCVHPKRTNLAVPAFQPKKMEEQLHKSWRFLFVSKPVSLKKCKKAAVPRLSDIPNDNSSGSLFSPVDAAARISSEE